MYLDYTSEQRKLRDHLRDYFTSLRTPELEPEDEPAAPGTSRQAASKRIIRKLGADGWLGVGWPKEFGGRGMTPLEQFIFYDEVNRAGVPYPMVTIGTVGPTLMRFGTEEQKQRFLPPILRGEIEFAIGYTEPKGGTDLASLTTRAERVADGYVVNGNKIFTTGGNIADYVWLAARTDPTAPKHKGISILIVDTNDPGFSATPIHVLGESTTTATYYSDVHVPEENRVGDENEGWTYITNQLNHERAGMGAGGARAIQLLADVRTWAINTKTDDGSRVIDQPWVRLTLGRAHARLDAMKLLNWKVAAELNHDTLSPADASAVKVYGTEVRIEVARLLLDIVGPTGAFRAGSSSAVLQGRLEREYRGAVVGTFGGGNNEIQREIVSRMALGMPRVRH